MTTVRKRKAVKGETFYVAGLPEHEADISHWIKPENLRPEAEKLVSKIMKRGK